MCVYIFEYTYVYIYEYTYMYEYIYIYMIFSSDMIGLNWDVFGYSQICMYAFMTDNYIYVCLIYFHTHTHIYIHAIYMYVYKIYRHKGTWSFRRVI